MENTNKLEIKKYIKLDDGRVLESSKVTIFDYPKNGILYHYMKEWNDEGTAFSLIKVVGESDYLYKFNTDNEFELDVVIKQPNGEYDFIIDFNPDNEAYITKKWIPCLLMPDQEVLLGSWYEGSMRFVAKWNSEKKDWELL